MPKIVALFAAFLLFTANTAAQELVGIAYFDLSLDEEGRVTEAVCADETHPVLIDPLRNWIVAQAFAHATVDDRRVPSTTSVWISYELKEADGGYELVVRNHDSGPRPIKRVAPDYPVAAALAEREGSVRLRFTVLPSGRVSNATVVESSDEAFTLEAIRTIKQWRFKPNTADGRLISSAAEQTIEFRLSRPAP